MAVAAAAAAVTSFMAAVQPSKAVFHPQAHDTTVRAEGVDAPLRRLLEVAIVLNNPALALNLTVKGMKQVLVGCQSILSSARVHPSSREGTLIHPAALTAISLVLDMLLQQACNSGVSREGSDPADTGSELREVGSSALRCTGEVLSTATLYLPMYNHSLHAAPMQAVLLCAGRGFELHAQSMRKHAQVALTLSLHLHACIPSSDAPLTHLLLSTGAAALTALALIRRTVDMSTGRRTAGPSSSIVWEPVPWIVALLKEVSVSLGAAASAARGLPFAWHSDEQLACQLARIAGADMCSPTTSTSTTEDSGTSGAGTGSLPEADTLPAVVSRRVAACCGLVGDVIQRLQLPGSFERGQVPSSTVPLPLALILQVIQSLCEPQHLAAIGLRHAHIAVITRAALDLFQTVMACAGPVLCRFQAHICKLLSGLLESASEEVRQCGLICATKAISCGLLSSGTPVPALCVSIASVCMGMQRDYINNVIGGGALSIAHTALSTLVSVAWMHAADTTRYGIESLLLRLCTGEHLEELVETARDGVSGGSSKHGAVTDSSILPLDSEAPEGMVRSYARRYFLPQGTSKRARLSEGGGSGGDSSNFASDETSDVRMQPLLAPGISIASGSTGTHTQQHSHGSGEASSGSHGGSGSTSHASKRHVGVQHPAEVNDSLAQVVATCYAAPWACGSASPLTPQLLAVMRRARYGVALALPSLSLLSAASPAHPGLFCFVSESLPASALTRLDADIPLGHYNDGGHYGAGAIAGETHGSAGTSGSSGVYGASATQSYSGSSGTGSGHMHGSSSAVEAQHVSATALAPQWALPSASSASADTVMAGVPVPAPITAHASAKANNNNNSSGGGGAATAGADDDDEGDEFPDIV